MPGSSYLPTVSNDLFTCLSWFLCGWESSFWQLFCLHIFNRFTFCINLFICLIDSSGVSSLNYAKLACSSFYINAYSHCLPVGGAVLHHWCSWRHFLSHKTDAHCLNSEGRWYQRLLIIGGRAIISAVILNLINSFNNLRCKHIYKLTPTGGEMGWMEMKMLERVLFLPSEEKGLFLLPQEALKCRDLMTSLLNFHLQPRWVIRTRWNSELIRTWFIPTSKFLFMFLPM